MIGYVPRNGEIMVQSRVKLRLSATVEKQLNDWLWMLMGIHNFTVRKIELDVEDVIYHTSMGFQNLLAEHSKKIGIPSHTVQGRLSQVHMAWPRCFKKIGGKSKLKGK